MNQFSASVQSCASRLELHGNTALYLDICLTKAAERRATRLDSSLLLIMSTFGEHFRVTTYVLP